MKIVFEDNAKDFVIKIDGIKDGVNAVLINNIRRTANFIQTTWIKTLREAKSPEGWKRKYEEAIGIDFESPLSAIVRAESTKFVNFVEKGVKRFDMKPGLLNGPKSRQGKNGRYNIIFLRKGTPGSQRLPNMSFSVYQKAKELDSGDVAKRYRVAGTDGQIKMLNSTVKKRVHTGGKKRVNDGTKETSGSGIMKLGSDKHTQYGNFVVVTKKSTGWIYPGFPAAKVFPSVKQKARTVVASMLQEGLEHLLKGET